MRIAVYGLLFLLPLLVSCGSKSQPSLKAYEKPNGPSSLRVQHRENRITIFWQYQDNLRKTLKGFFILRSEGKEFKKLAFTDNAASSFIDSNFKSGSRYQYKVIAQSLKDVLSNDSDIITAIPQPLPLPPQEIKFVMKSGFLELSWKNSGENICYNIYKTTEKSKYENAPINREPVCAESFKDTAILTDSPVYYTIRALLNNYIMDEGYASDELPVIPAEFIPSAPTDLRIVIGENNIHLMWKESPEPYVKGYHIYRRVAGETEFKNIGEVKIPAFTDSKNAGRKVWYMIKAVGLSRESGPLYGDVLPAQADTGR